MSLGTPGLLAWRVEGEELVRPAFAAAAGSGSSSSAATAAEAPTAAAPELSVVDRIAAPAAFLHQALVFKGALEPAQLRAALAEVRLWPADGVLPQSYARFLRSALFSYCEGAAPAQPPMVRP